MPTNWNTLKLRQKLKDWNQLLEKLSPQQQRLVWLSGGALVLLLFYLVVVSPLLGLEDSWSQDLAQKRQLLAKYQSLIQSKAQVMQANKAMKAALARTESQFLSGSSPAVASADLQEILKNLTREHGVQLTSTKVLQPREAGPYLEVPVQVQLSGNVGQLLTILYHLEHHKKLLFIPDLEINAPRWMARAAAKKDAPLQVNLVVSGVIKKGVAS
jgi:type II secretory pathway component PulM